MPVIEGATATHTTFESTDIRRSLRFYTEVMGLASVQRMEKSGLFRDTKGMITASIQMPKVAPQPFLNFYARPVPDAAAVDRVHRDMLRAKDAYAIQEITHPAREDPSGFGVGTYGFYVKDPDGNWWRVEDNDGPFGPAEIPADAEPRQSIVPAGPVSYVTLESRDLGRTMRYFREFLGLDVEPRAPHYFASRGNGGVNVICVEVGDRLTPQTVMNHHGITLGCEGDRIRGLNARAKEVAADFGILKVMGATSQHGSYSFYMQDPDTNWWEIEMLEDELDPWQQTLRDGEYGTQGMTRSWFKGPAKTASSESVTSP